MCLGAAILDNVGTNSRVKQFWVQILIQPLTCVMTLQTYLISLNLNFPIGKKKKEMILVLTLKETKCETYMK